MKRIFLSLCLILLCGAAFSQRSYLFIRTNASGAIVSGDRSDDIQDYYMGTDFGYKMISPSFWIGDLLNLMAEKGFVVEKMNSLFDSEDNIYFTYLLSRDRQDAEPATSVQSLRKAGDGTVKEVARYNLQGIPVGKDEKGLQVIVYSNYTTKTVIVE